MMMRRNDFLADGATRKKTPTDIICKQRLNNIEHLKNRFVSVVTRMQGSQLLRGQTLTEIPPCENMGS